MSNRVTWQPSADPAIYSYVLQSSPDATVWTTLDTIIDAPRSALNANWDVTNSVFFYTDAGGVSYTWYRLAAVDTLAQQSAWSPAFQPIGGLIPVWDTAGHVINDACVEIGLSPVADPYASVDPNVVQMCYLLKSLGRELVHMRAWNHLRAEHTFTTVAGQSTYPLPADYHNMIDQTWWNRTNRLPVGGPLSPQEWQYLKARLVGVVFNVLFRPMDRLISLYPDTNTPGGQVIAFEYSSAFWVSTAGTPDTATADYPTLSSDFVWFDPLILVRGLKLAFLKAKGFDTTSVQQDYNRVLESMKGADSPSAILSATRGGARGPMDPLIGNQSVPITGFG